MFHIMATETGVQEILPVLLFPCWGAGGKKKKKKLAVQQVLPEISLQPSDCEFVALEMTLLSPQ